MKKALKWGAIVFCGMGLVAYTSMMFTEDPTMRPVFIMGDIVLLLLLILLLRKKRPKAQTMAKSSTPASKPIEYKKVHHSAKLDDTALDDFYIKNYAFLQPLEHQAVAPQMKNYGDIDSYRLAYEICLNALHTLKDFCYTSDEGKKWYESMYCHCFNSHCKDFSLEVQLEKGYEDLIENWVVYERRFQAKKDATDFLIENGPYIRRTIIEIIKSEPGILQKDIYDRFDPSYKQAVISTLGAMNREKVLFREPYKNTFKLYVSPPVLRDQSFNIQD